MNEIDDKLGGTVVVPRPTAPDVPAATARGVGWGESPQAQAGLHEMMSLAGGLPADWREVAERKRKEVEARAANP